MLEDYLGIALLRRGRFGVEASDELRAALPQLHSAFVALETAAAVLDLQREHDLHIAEIPTSRIFGWRRGSSSSAPNSLTFAFYINGEGDAPARIGKPDCEIVFDAPVTSDNSDVLVHDFALPLCTARKALIVPAVI